METFKLSIMAWFSLVSLLARETNWMETDFALGSYYVYFMSLLARETNWMETNPMLPVATLRNITVPTR